MNSGVFGEKLQGLVAGIRTTFNSITKKDTNNIKPDGYNESAANSRWVQSEKFLNFTGMQVAVPAGLETYMMTHIERLESVWSVIQNIESGLLIPVDKQFSLLANDPGLLTLPVGFRMKDFNYPLRNIDPKDLVKKLANSYGNKGLGQRAIEKTYQSAADIDSVYSRVSALHGEIDKKLRTTIDKHVESIGISAGIIAESNVNPACAAELSKMIDRTSEWISLFGLFMKQTNEVLNATVENNKQFTQLRKARG